MLLRPNAAEGKDAEVFSLEPDQNRGDLGIFRGLAWTFSFEEGIVRGLIDFDISSIPPGSFVHSAHLSLYGVEKGHSQVHSGENEVYMRRIHKYWGESEVTWDNQPEATSQHEILLPASSEGTQNYENKIQVC